MPKINHNIPNFDKRHDEFKKQLETQKGIHKKVRPTEFDMTRREREKNERTKMNQTMTLNLPKTKTMQKAQFSMNNFRKAEQAGKHMKISTTKKFEDTKKARLIEREKKEKEEMERKGNEMLKKER